MSPFAGPDTGDSTKATHVQMESHTVGKSAAPPPSLSSYLYFTQCSEANLVQHLLQPNEKNGHFTPLPYPFWYVLCYLKFSI